MSRLSQRWRHRTVVRPRERARRVRAAFAVAALALLGALTGIFGRHAVSFAQGAWSRRFSAGSAQAVIVEGAEPLRSLAQSAADAAGGSAREKSAALRARFSCLSDVAASKPWGRGPATLSLVLRRAVAPALRRGRPAGILGEDGLLFEAPAGVYELSSGPSVDVEGARIEELKTLAHEWPALSAPGAFPAPLVGLAYRGPDQGWQAKLVDGTMVLWGRLDWTKEKLARLGEALADARRRGPKNFTADLRWFEDGKILLKPLKGAL